MKDDKKDEFKKGLSNSLIWFLMAAFFMALMVQNFIDAKIAKISFSYQLEHLVNLQLTQPEENRKIALNDNLVTFSGRFRERKTEDGKKRFKFLELLDENHLLKTEMGETVQEITALKPKVVDSAKRFYDLAGIAAPPQGVVIAGKGYTFQDQDFSLTINDLQKPTHPNLADLIKEIGSLSPTATDSLLDNAQESLLRLVQGFRSPAIGIGNQQIKLALAKMESDLESLKKPIDPAVLKQTTAKLKDIVDEISKGKEGTALTDLRSVRSYKDAVETYSKLSTKLEDNRIQLEKAESAVAGVVWFYNNKEVSTKGLEKEEPEAFKHWFNNAKEEWDAFEQNAGGVFKAPDQPLNMVLEKRFKSQEPTPNYFSYLITILPFLLVILILYFIFSRQMKGMNSSALNFGKSPARLLNKDQNKITFKDVAGLEEEIEELQEIVDFLKNPKKFTALGGRIPKGVLLVGPPGTGKTLIGKAVAGEANRPFFSISGSDFVEMFVGVGASRIRDLFDQAKKSAPCIIFIDEIDAVGRHRGAGIGGGHDEREQTLNQLLVEMDGFDTNEGVIIMAATNRPDVLDKALLRPGRFDRRVMVSLPDIKGRFEILKVHAKKIKLDPSVDLMKIARATPGCSGADLANILNEAALLAARRGRTAVTGEETQEARDKVLYGKERRSMQLDEQEKLTTAYHESGHAIVGLHVEHSDPVDKVTIIPRGFSLGATMFLPKKNKVSYWRKELIDQLAVLMGGRCAEEVFVGDISSGARQDIQQATKLAHSMICEWGMSDKMGVVFYGESSDSGYHGIGGHYEKQYSDDTAKAIDEELKRILQEAHEKALNVIEKYKNQVELMTQMLLKYETLSQEDVEEIANDTFEENKTIKRRQDAEEAHKKKLPPVPPKQDKEDSSNGNEAGPAITQDIRV